MSQFAPPTKPSLAELFGDAAVLRQTQVRGDGPSGRLPISEADLLQQPSGHLFGMTQNAGMGWRPEEVGRDQYLIVSTQGGMRDADGKPIALGYHTGHWEIGLLVQESARTLAAQGVLPFSAYCSDPCDGRTQGTVGMFDSLPYRNDAAVTLRRLIRSLPERKGVLGIATCDKGLPAMMLAAAGVGQLPSVIVPGGVTLPARDAEDAGTVQTLGARYAHRLVTLNYAAEMGCRACGSPGGGCQFLGTAATSQVVAEALGWCVPHAALAPSGQPAWFDVARRSALALLTLARQGVSGKRILTQRAIENAMLVHAAFGGSTNLLLHLPAIAHAAGLRVPRVEDWTRINRSTPRLVDALPNGPRHHPTSVVYLAGGVPEVLLRLRQMGLLASRELTVCGVALDDVLDWWEQSERRHVARARLREVEGIEPAQVIHDADSARRAGMTSTVVFPTGNLAPEGSVVKATAIDSSVVGEDGVYRHRGPARVFTSEQDAIRAIKAVLQPAVRAGDVVVVIGVGPLGTGMEETYQLTSALKHLPWGKQVPIITDARFSGVSTGACIGHVGPEALAGGPLGKLRDGDWVEIVVDTQELTGSVRLVATPAGELSEAEARELLARRPPHPALAPHPELPADTRLWALLQRVSGGTWSGCVYDVERLERVITAGLEALSDVEDPASSSRGP